MPHMSSGGSEDFYSKDEVKVYKDEGEEEKRSSENLSEEKLGLVTESEEGKNGSLSGNYPGNEKSSSTRSDDDKSASQPPGQGQGPLNFIMPPYYANGASMGNSKIGMVQPPYPGLVMYNDFGSPPPAHMGIPPVHTDPKTGLPRPPMYATYPAPPGQFPHHLYPEFSQWHRPAGYPISSGGFSGTYPPLINTSISRLGHPGILPHPGLPHPGMPPHPIMSPGPKQEMMAQAMAGVDNHRSPLSSNVGDNDSGGSIGSGETNQRKKPYVKKPLNAFMLFMKEMRPKVISECTLRESAAINQILGRKVGRYRIRGANTMVWQNEQAGHAFTPSLPPYKRVSHVYSGTSGVGGVTSNHKQITRDHRNPKTMVFLSFFRPSLSSNPGDNGSGSNSGNGENTQKKKPYVKKPLNAFMLYMKEMRAKVIADCTLKESAAINQILGKKWHALDRAEQSKYYDMARKEKELHLQLYPGWSARDNYASHAKKKKRKKEGPGENKGECTHAKKCRARFGMEQQTQWCKPCRSLHDTKCEHDSSAELETKKSADV